MIYQTMIYHCLKSTIETPEEYTYEICLKLIIETSKPREPRSGVFGNFEQISNIVLMLSLLAVNK